MKIIKNGINAVPGFSSLGKHVGIKKKNLDLAVIYSSKMCNVAGVFTTNKVQGAPVKITKDHIKNGKAQAIIVNSGIANVSTGKKGLEDGNEMCKLAAKELSLDISDVLVASTGLIGAFLPMNKIKKGVKGIKKELSKDGKSDQAILTSDGYKKEIAVKVDGCTIGAIAKGAGMIHPNMATMLAFIATDAKFSSLELKKMLKESVNKSFNMLSVDMDMSTSDMALILSNGACKCDKKKFQKALDFVCVSLAKMMAKDGEGATKMIVAKVVNAKGAKILARSIVSSNLVKCAAYGNDPNWGRIMGAMGSAGVDFDVNKVDIYFGKKKIVKNGVEVKFNYKDVSNMMKKELVITVDMKSGKEKATAYGCDMTHAYVELNSKYHT